MSTWFRKGGFTCTLSVPPTPGDRLTAMMQNSLTRCSAPGRTKTKVVTRGGRSVRSVLVRSNPFPRQQCDRVTCPLRWQEEGCYDRCHQEHIGYSAHCNLCRSQQLEQDVELSEVEDRVYYGESARTIHQRASQHLGDYRSNLPGSRAKPRSSWMFDHLLKHHDGVPGPDPATDCTFRLQGAFTDCLGRQLDECVRLDLVEERGEVVGDRGEGRGGRTVEILNRRGEGGEYHKPKTVKYFFFQE